MSIYKVKQGIYIARVKINGFKQLFQGRTKAEAIAKALSEVNLLQKGYLNL